MGGMGALVGRHVFLSHPRGVCGRRGRNQEESSHQRETVAGAEAAVVAANVGVCGLHSDGVVSARASAMSRL